MTNFTQNLVDRDLNFKDFTLLCSRAFGVCISMRDDDLSAPIPEEFKLNEYHKNALEVAQKKLNDLKTLSKKELTALAKNNIKQAIEDNQKYIAEMTNKDEYGKCERMLEKVKNWNPPTDEHVGLKDFMIQQLESSIKYKRSNYFEEQTTRLEAMKPKAYYEEMIAAAEKDVKYHSQAWEEEQERNRTSNKWLKDLRESLE